MEGKTDHRSLPEPRPVAGVLFAAHAFLIWGLSPIYWKTLAHVPAFEILMHRMIWSFIFLLPIVALRKRWPAFREAVTDPKVLFVLTATTLIVGFNWFLFIWAINNNHVLQTSLGYYINPLLNVVLGVVFLRERLRLPQVLAVLLAAIGVAYLTWEFGKLPWVSLTLAMTFGLYGLIHKVAPVGSLVGLAVETLILSLPAAAYLFYIDSIDRGSFFRVGLETDFLLMGAALVTALPLLLFTLGARRIHYSTLGLLQYIAPSCTFLLAVFIYREPFSHAQLLCFILIWAALIIYSTDSLIHYRKSGVSLPSSR
jgi:chloramphenicol-sensitive protein RarD